MKNIKLRHRKWENLKAKRRTSWSPLSMLTTKSLNGQSKAISQKLTVVCNHLRLQSRKILCQSSQYYLWTKKPRVCSSVERNLNVMKANQLSEGQSPWENPSQWVERQVLGHKSMFSPEDKLFSTSDDNRIYLLSSQMRYRQSLKMKSSPIKRLLINLMTTMRHGSQC